MKPELFTLENDSMRCLLSSFGASVIEVTLKLPGGERLVTLASESLRTGGPDPSLAGRCIAPGCGRLAKGKCTVDGREITLSLNEGQNHLHGGFEAAQYCIWRTVAAGKESAEFALTLSAGLDGYPGDREIRVLWTMKERSLMLNWHAETTEPTPFELTNHIYWDLTGTFNGGAMNQILTANAARYVVNDENHTPLYQSETAGTAFDFRAGRSFAQQLTAYPDDVQLKIGRGFNNAFVFDDRVDLTLQSPDRINMHMVADRPCAVIYTGGFLDSATQIPSGSAVPRCAAAIEPQRITFLPPDILRPGKPADHFIQWTFDF